MLYDGMSTIRDGSTDWQLLDRWPDSPQHWGHNTWAEVGPYAIGHGLGLTLHDRPFFNRMNQVAGVPEQTFREGMVLAIEPMINAGSHEVEMGDDNWAIYTKDGSLSAHFEHTVAITKNGPRILTVAKTAGA